MEKPSVRTDLLCLCVALVAALASPMPAAELQALLARLQSAGREGRDNPALTAAWKEVVKADVTALPKILVAIDKADTIAANWLGAAVEVIAERSLAAGQKLPTQQLEELVLDRAHHPQARRLAYEWLARVDKTAPERLIPGMLDDPSVEFRRDAVARLIARGGQQLEASDKAAALSTFARAMSAARDQDQVKVLVKQLAKLGQKVDLPRHFGFLMTWKLIGPFDNTNKGGFDVAYPPEREIDLAARYTGKVDEVHWFEHITSDNYGKVDLNKAIGKHMGVVGYAWTEFDSPTERDVELRMGCKNAFKVWLNGQLVFARDEYHRGQRMDQYRMPVTLRAGRNGILLKICQDEQKVSWAQQWEFQIRACDATGTAVLSANRGKN